MSGGNSKSMLRNTFNDDTVVYWGYKTESDPDNKVKSKESVYIPDLKNENDNWKFQAKKSNDAVQNFLVLNGFKLRHKITIEYDSSNHIWEITAGESIPVQGDHRSKKQEPPGQTNANVEIGPKT